MYEIHVEVDYDLLLVELKSGEQLLSTGYYPTLSDGMFEVQKELLIYIGEEWK